MQPWHKYFANNRSTQARMVRPGTSASDKPFSANSGAIKKLPQARHLVGNIVSLTILYIFLANLDMENRIAGADDTKLSCFYFSGSVAENLSFRMFSAGSMASGGTRPFGISDLGNRCDLSAYRFKISNFVIRHSSFVVRYSFAARLHTSQPPLLPRHLENLGFQVGEWKPINHNFVLPGVGFLFVHRR